MKVAMTLVLEPDLAERLRAMTADVESRTGIRVERSTMIRKLLSDSLTAEGYPAKWSKP